MRSARLVGFGLLVASVALPSRAAEFEGLWRSPDGLTLESRAVDDTDHAEFRVRFRVAATALTLADIVWSQRPSSELTRYLSKLDVLSLAPTVRLEHQVLSLPLLGRREAIIRFSRSESPVGEVVIEYSSRCRECAMSAPAPVMHVIRGVWRFVPDGDGAWVELRSVSDPGGVPPFLTHGTERAMAIELVRDVARRGTIRALRP